MAVTFDTLWDHGFEIGTFVAGVYIGVRQHLSANRNARVEAKVVEVAGKVDDVKQGAVVLEAKIDTVHNGMSHALAAANTARDQATGALEEARHENPQKEGA
jgi:hypothetical protein